MRILIKVTAQPNNQPLAYNSLQMYFWERFSNFRQYGHKSCSVITDIPTALQYNTLYTIKTSITGSHKTKLFQHMQFEYGCRDMMLSSR